MVFCVQQSDVIISLVVACIVYQGLAKVGLAFQHYNTHMSYWWHVNYYQNFHQKDPQDKTVQSPYTGS